MNNISDVINYINNNNNNLQVTELIPIYTNQNSFYKKAIVKKINNLILLYSYDTLVCAIYDCAKYTKYVLNDNINNDLLFSNTTLKHIKEFLYQNTYGFTNKLKTKKDIIKYNNFEFVDGGISK